MTRTTGMLAATAAALLALPSVVRAQGNAIVQNQCDFDVYLWHISANRTDSSPHVLSANGGSYSEQYVYCSTGGVSLKLSDSATQVTFITQYEYTLDPNTVWYDLSNVNCQGTNCPFWKYGMSLKSNTGCPVVNCAAGDQLCHAVYNLFNDDWASHACQPSSDLTMVLCSDKPSGSSSGSSSNAPAAAAAAVAPPSSAETSTTSAAFTPPTIKANLVSPVVASSSSTSTTPTPTPSTPSSTSTESTPTSTSTSSHHKKHKHHKSKKPQTTSKPVVEVAAVTQWFTETEVETAYSTVVVTVRDTNHEEFHKNKKREAAANRHLRRHQHF